MAAPLLLPPLPFLTSCFVLVGWWRPLVPHQLMLVVFLAIFAMTPAVLSAVFAVADYCVVLVPLLAPSEISSPSLLLAPLELTAACWLLSPCVPLGCAAPAELAARPSLLADSKRLGLLHRPLG